MEWISKMKLSEHQLFPSADKNWESESDEGSTAMFTIIGPLAQRNNASVPPATCSPTPPHCAVQVARIETSAVEDQPIKKPMRLFDDTAYTIEERTEMSFR
jgi:hypothetical protein